ncbi:MAG: sigma-70 family RNA polymerase sigma factor [Acidobacteriota bacterium]
MAERDDGATETGATGEVDIEALEAAYGAAGGDGSAEPPDADDSDPEDITELLLRWGEGRPEALDQLLPVLYAELRAMATRSLRKERSGHTLQATALVNEAYLRIVNQDRIRWQNRAQFFGVASEMMRRILVDHARRRQAAKRDGGVRITLEDGLSGARGAGSATREVNLIALDEALTRLQDLDPRQARIVEMRYFAGLKIEETAEVLGVSARTVKREWQMARAWLKRELAHADHA